jgi:hypothetical protein
MTSLNAPFGAIGLKVTKLNVTVVLFAPFYEILLLIIQVEQLLTKL